MANSILRSTKITYSTGVRRWVKFVQEFGTDVFMRKIPPEFLQYQSEVDSFHHSSWQEACFMSFLEWLQGPPKPTAPATASNYLCAVKHHLACHGLDVSSLVSSTVLSKQKRGNRNTYLADEHNLEANRRTLPLSVDILLAERPDPASKSPLRDLAFFTALLMGFTMLTRVSNYLPVSSAAYRLDSEHVSFSVTPPPGGDGAPVEVSADQLGDIPLSRIIGASAFLARSKTDGSGKGKRIPFLRQLVNPPSCVYDIVTVLYEYVQAARPARGKSFFYIPSLFWSLSPAHYNLRLRAVARREARFGSRSGAFPLCPYWWGNGTGGCPGSGLRYHGHGGVGFGCLSTVCSPVRSNLCCSASGPCAFRICVRLVYPSDASDASSVPFI